LKHSEIHAPAYPARRSSIKTEISPVFASFVPPPQRLVGALFGVLAFPVLAASPLGIADGEQSFDEILRTSGQSPIGFVQVNQDQPHQVQLDIYYDNLTKKLPWSNQSGKGTVAPLQLGPREAFVQSSDWRTLGKRILVPFDPSAGMLPGAIQETRFEFIKGPPGVQPLAPVPGARQVEIAEDGMLLLFIQREREQDGPARTDIFRFDPQNQGAFLPSGSYDTTLQGTVQASRSKGVIAQIDGDRVEILSNLGEARDSTPSGIGVRLGREGRVLAVCQADGVSFQPLDPDGKIQLEQVQRFGPLQGPVLDVVIAGRYALVQTSTVVYLVEWPTHSELWRQEYTRGKVTSVDLDVQFKAGDADVRSFVVAIGRLDISRMPGRSNGQHIWGAALGSVDVFLMGRHQEEDARLITTSSFRTERWTHEEPRARILERSHRVLVRSSDVVLTSSELEW
jgi:hypothetical protein